MRILAIILKTAIRKFVICKLKTLIYHQLLKQMFVAIVNLIFHPKYFILSQS